DRRRRLCDRRALRLRQHVRLHPERQADARSVQPHRGRSWRSIERVCGFILEETPRYWKRPKRAARKPLISGAPGRMLECVRNTIKIVVFSFPLRAYPADLSRYPLRGVSLRARPAWRAVDAF